MKKLYETPFLEIQSLTIIDIICASYNGEDPMYNYGREDDEVGNGETPLPNYGKEDNEVGNGEVPLPNYGQKDEDDGD